MRSLETFRDDTSYYTEDNCPGVRYVVPVHMLGDLPCWYSNRILTEGQLDAPTDTPNQLDRQYTCGGCGACFSVIISDRPAVETESRAKRV